mgnify:FL=1
MKQATISVQDLSGAWAQIGTGQLRGIQPSDVELTSDTWGAKDATFTLTRELFVPWPDIQAFAPVEIAVGGVVVWRGRIVDAPTNSLSRSIAVRCEGKQNHLDDDQYERVYVHTDITQWQDARGSLDADLTLWRAAGLVTSGDGVISLSWPVGTQWDATVSVGVILDLGPSAVGAAKAELTFRRLAGNPSMVVLAMRSAESVDRLRGTGTFTDGFTPVALSSTTTTAQTVEATLSPTDRYVCVLLRCDTTYTPTLEDGIAIDAIQVFTDTAYVSGGVSVLRGDQVVKDALNTATVQLSDDQSLIDSTGSSFYIPEFAPSGPRTPRQAIEGVNVFYDWRTKVDEQDRFVFEDRAGEAPSVRVGRWGSSSFEDASSASGDEVYNKAIVTGQDPSGVQIREVVTSGDLSNVVYEDITGAHLSNPGFESGTSGWAASGSTITQVTTPHTGTYGGRWDNSGASDALSMNDYLEITLTGTFLAGVRYRIYPWIRTNSGTTTAVQFQVGDFATGDVTPNVYNRLPWSVTSSYTVPSHAYKTWIPKATTNNVTYRITDLGSGKFFYIDDMTVEVSLPTIVDRRQFTRAHTLDASFMLTDSSANRLGKIFLEAHRTTPFKGQGQVVGHNAARDYTTGQPLGPERLLMMTDRLMHFDDRIDPDTGAVGRDGRIVSVRYTPATDTASFDIDNSRKDFDALLERLGVSIGQIR